MQTSLSHLFTHLDDVLLQHRLVSASSPLEELRVIHALYKWILSLRLYRLGPCFSEIESRHARESCNDMSTVVAILGNPSPRPTPHPSPRSLSSSYDARSNRFGIGAYGILEKTICQTEACI